MCGICDGCFGGAVGDCQSFKSARLDFDQRPQWCWFCLDVRRFIGGRRQIGCGVPNTWIDGNVNGFRSDLERLRCPKQCVVFSRQLGRWNQAGGGNF